MTPAADSWFDDLNPFDYLAGEAGKVVADGWTAAMLGLWNAGLWVLRLVLNLMDAFLTPDLSGDGPGAAVYQTTFWLAGVLVLAMVMIQLGVAAARRDAKSLATVGIGLAQFMIVWAGWISYGVGVLAAVNGLTRALLQTLLQVDSWSAWQPWERLSLDDITDGTVATVLGLMGLLLWVSAIGHLLVMLTRAGALIVLATTTPISAAGLVSEAGRSWFWKSLRWFHAAAFTPVLMVAMLGIGVQLTSGVATGMDNEIEKAIGTALPGVVLILIASFSPLALFKLLAFVDPGTSSGAALRQGLAAQGGLQGLLSGGGASDPGSGAAASADGNGRSQGESASQDATNARFTQAQGNLLSTLGGAVGTAAATGLGVMATIGTTGAAVGSDVAAQMGVGHQTYHPDFSSGRTPGSSRGQRSGDQGVDPDAGEPGPSGTPPDATDPPTGMPDAATSPAPSTDQPTKAGATPKGGPGQVAGAGAEGGSAAEAAVVVVAL